MPSTTPSKTGTVYLVGAGPGDPRLITLRGMECLQRADVVLYDYLVNPVVLRHAPPGAELICLGRHGRDRIVPQETINAQLVEHARGGKTTVRLKGGDPTIFARCFEEVETLIAAKIPYEIVPGVTVAVAVGSYAAIPCTHRELASAVAIVTGHECQNKQGPDLDYEGLARFPGTLVIYMGVTTADRWTQALIEAGKPATTPTAIVRRCSLPDQQVVRTELGQVAHEIKTQHIRPPAVIVVGDVVTQSESMRWFVDRPLFGKTVLVTRPQEQAYDLCDRLEELGARCLVQPAIEIQPPSDWKAVDAALERLDDFDWLVFSSANGVRFFLDRLLEQGDIRRLGRVKIASIGPGTTRELSKYRLTADLEPTEHRAESLAAAILGQGNGLRTLLVRASRGREVLADTLRGAGHHVEQVVAYTSRDVTMPDAEIHQALRDGQIDWITVTSSAIARASAAMFGADLTQAKLASISPITSAVLQEIGLTPAAEADVYTTEGIVDAIQDRELDEKSA